MVICTETIPCDSWSKAARVRAIPFMHTEPDTPDSSEANPTLRVLVADDGKNAADILGLFVKMEGYEVRVVYDGEEAVREWEGFFPHVILMDLQMPGTDGFEATRRIREAPGGERPLIYALSGFDQAEVRRQCEAAGFHQLIPKPVSPADLRELLKESARIVEDANEAKV